MASIRHLLAKYDVEPSKGLGQSFLTDHSVMDTIISAADLTADDVVLEIGPGLGLLTRRLADAARLVVAVELDARMVGILEHELAEYPNLVIVRGDVLEIDVVGILQEAAQQEQERLCYQVVANLPYYITSQAIRQLLEARVPPERMVLMVQLEVAERIIAEPGEMSLLALSVQLYGAPRLVRRVPATAFYPRPNVASAVLRVDVHHRPLADADVRERVFRLARAAFGQRRKQMHNSLAANLGLPKGLVKETLFACGIDPRRRPQSLAIDEWLRLAEAFA
ncbi:MAG: 16S rRNA (adenine(1518)-N(6)/adenine(1519)-N(6))-dimethyltransferase RsmA [Anaerolineae bacterium]